MIYNSAKNWADASQKRVAIFAMSGLGKTYLSTMLSEGNDWFHYSVDYRIGTHYMGGYYEDKTTIENLEPLSTYMGKPGNPDKGGIPFEEYVQRQRQHRIAEISAIKDIAVFIVKTQERNANFIADTSGSVCEVVTPEDMGDPVMSALSNATLPVWIKGNAGHVDVLMERFASAPKPMYYREDFLRAKWDEYLRARDITEDAVDPDDFILWGYRELLDHRMPIYEAMARNWGVTIDADEVSQIRDENDFNALIEQAIDRKT